MGQDTKETRAARIARQHAADMARFDRWLASCKELPCGHPDIPATVGELDMHDFLTCHVFADGAWFLEVSKDSYWGIVCCDEMESGGWVIMASWLWENWSRTEWDE